MLSRSRRASGAALGVLLSASLLLPACASASRGGTSPAPVVRGGTSPASAAPRGAFLIRSNPPGAQVYIDGTLVGTTPLDYPRDNGEPHRLSLTLEGYEPSEGLVDFRGEGLMVELSVAPVPDDEARRVLGARDMLPAVTAVPNPAGNRAWRIKGLWSFSASVSPNGRYLVGLVQGGAGRITRTDHVAVDLESGRVWQIASRIDKAGHVALEPEPVGWLGGSEVAILTARESPDDPQQMMLALLKVDLATGQQEWLGDFGPAGPGGVKRSWLTSDGKRAFAHVSGHVWGLDLATKQRVLDVPVPSWDGLFMLTPSPDGWSAARPELNPQGYARVYWIDLRTGKDQPVSPSGLYADGAWWSADSRRLAFGVSAKGKDGYPVLPGEDSGTLLPDAIEIVDLPTLSRQHIDLPKTPATFDIADDFRTAVVSEVRVTGDPTSPEAWQLQKQALRRVDLRTGTVGSATPLQPLPGTRVAGVGLGEGADYLVTLAPADESMSAATPAPADESTSAAEVPQGTRLARLHPDGSMEVLPGMVFDPADRALVWQDWALLRFDDGIDWPDGTRLLSGPAVRAHYFARLSQGTVLLEEMDDNAVTVVANPGGGGR